MFTDNLTVRINDINFGGHLGHVEFIHLLHQVRVRYLHQYSLSETDMLGQGLVMRHMDVTYLSPAYVHDQLQFLLTVSVNKARFQFDYQVNNLTRDNKMGQASLQMVLIDLQTGRPVRVGHQLLESISNPNLDGTI